MRHRKEGGFTASDTVGLVVEYAPATGETRVRFPDGVENLHKKRPSFCPISCFFVTQHVFLLPAPSLYFRESEDYTLRMT